MLLPFRLLSPGSEVLRHREVRGHHETGGVPWSDGRRESAALRQKDTLVHERRKRR